jgi:hypothetical protein
MKCETCKQEIPDMSAVVHNLICERHNYFCVRCNNIFPKRDKESHIESHNIVESHKESHIESHNRVESHDNDFHVNNFMNDVNNSDNYENSCPFCFEKFQNSDVLSIHVMEIHP